MSARVGQDDVAVPQIARCAPSIEEFFGTKPGKLCLPSKVWRDILWYVRNANKGNPSTKTTRRRLRYLHLDDKIMPMRKKFLSEFQKLTKHAFRSLVIYITKRYLKPLSPSNEGRCVVSPLVPMDDVRHPDMASVRETLSGGSDLGPVKAVASQSTAQSAPMSPDGTSSGSETKTTEIRLPSSFRSKGEFVQYMYPLFYKGNVLWIPEALPGKGRVTVFPEEEELVDIVSNTTQAQYEVVKDLAPYHGTAGLLLGEEELADAHFPFDRPHICGHPHGSCERSSTVLGFILNNPWDAFDGALVAELRAKQAQMPGWPGTSKPPSGFSFFRRSS